jgi:hypothetical protein
MRDPVQWRRTLGQSRWCGNRETQPEGTFLSRSLRAGRPQSITELDRLRPSGHQKNWLCSAVTCPKLSHCSSAVSLTKFASGLDSVNQRPHRGRHVPLLRIAAYSLST